MVLRVRFMWVAWCLVAVLVLACGLASAAYAEEVPTDDTTEAVSDAADTLETTSAETDPTSSSNETLDVDGPVSDADNSETEVEEALTPTPETDAAGTGEPEKETTVKVLEPIVEVSAAATTGTDVPAKKMTASTAKETTSKDSTPTSKKATATAQPKKGKGDLAEGSYYIVSALRTGSVVDVSGGSGENGANVQLYTVNGSGAQQWAVEVLKDGFALIRNLKSGKVLDVEGAVNKSGTNVQQYQSNGTKAQKWIIKNQGGKYVILSALAGNFALDVAGASTADGTNFQIYNRNNTKAQLFSFVSCTAKKAAIGKRTLADGVYTLRPLVSNTRVASIQNETTVSGGNAVIIEHDADNATQAFRLSYDGQGCYTITNVKTGMKLAPKAACSVPGINVGQYKLGNVDRAKWVVKKTAKGQFELRNKATNLVLDIYGAKDVDNSNVQLYKANNSKAQRFAVKRLDSLHSGIVALRPLVNLELAVDVKNGEDTAGATLQTYASNHTQAQKFRVEKTGNGFTLQALNSGLYLTADKKGTLTMQKAKKNNVGQLWLSESGKRGLNLLNATTGQAVDVTGASKQQGAKVQMYKGNGTIAQAFLVRDVEAVSEGVYNIVCSANIHIAVNTQDGNRRNYANVNMASLDTTNLQKFHIVPVGGGKYSITNVSSGRSIGVAAGSKASGANVDFYTYQGGAGQQWKVKVDKNCALTFINANSGMALDIVGGKIVDGQNVQVYKTNGTQAQKFRLKGTEINFGETVVLGVPCYNQNPQLPTGCESVALTNALRYWGFNLGKTTMANRMPRGNDGVYNFIGNPRDESGWIICAPGIKNMANSYLKSKGSSLRARNITGTSLRDLRKYLDKGQPVVVWTTIGMGQPVGLQYRHGYPLRGNNHAVVLSGYNPQNNKYQVADSLAGVVWRNGGAFNSLYNKMGKQAVVIED